LTLLCTWRQVQAECPAHLEPPLANLIPHMKNTARKIFEDDPHKNDYIRVSKDLRSVNLLCR
jgi:hypothetical protein